MTTSSVKWRLSAMMFLQFAVWGSWASVAGKYFSDIGFTGTQSGIIFGLLPLATAFAPMFSGQLADRYFSSEKLMAVFHLLGAAAMSMMARSDGYGEIVLWMAIFSLVYAPTIALTNSISFSNLGDPDREFGPIRVWGTIGWMAAGWILGFGRQLYSVEADLLYQAAFFSVLLAGFSLALPHTPPRHSGSNPFAFLDALKLFRNRNFAAFMIISFIVGTELDFYYLLTSPYLSHLGVTDSKIPVVMTIAQASEIIVMLLVLPVVLPRIGIRRMLAIGALAWPVRYAVFAIGEPLWLVQASLAMHGFCYVFFFVAGFIYVDRVAPSNIRASAQALLTMVILGFGRFVGSRLAGIVKDIFTRGETTNWTGVFLVPCALTIICAVSFLMFFKDGSEQPAAS